MPTAHDTRELEQQRAPLAERRDQLGAELRDAERAHASARTALAKGGGTAAAVADAQSIVSALRDAISTINGELSPIDAEIASRQAAAAAERKRLAAVKRAVDLSRECGAGIGAVTAARDAGVHALRTIINKRVAVKDLQRQFGAVMQSLGGATPELLSELEAAGADLGAVNTTFTRSGESTPLSHRIRSTVLSFPQEDAAALAFDEAANKFAVV
jgi:hypothetical protein